MQDPELDAIVDELPKEQQIAAHKAADEWRTRAGFF